MSGLAGIGSATSRGRTQSGDVSPWSGELGVERIDLNPLGTSVPVRRGRES